MRWLRWRSKELGDCSGGQSDGEEGVRGCVCMFFGKLCWMIDGMEKAMGQ